MIIKTEMFVGRVEDYEKLERILDRRSKK